MSKALVCVATTLAFAAGLPFAGQLSATAAPSQPHTAGTKTVVQSVAGRHFGGGGNRGGFRGGYRGGYRGGHYGGIGAAIIGGAIIAGAARGYDDYGGYGYSCRALEYRCDHGSDWACHRLDVDPNC